MTDYRITCVILDWAGTTVDFGCRAPVAAFTRTLAEAGIAIDEAAVRGPMGLEKRDHLCALLNLPAVNEQWHRRHGTAPDTTALDALYARFREIQLDVLDDHADPVPGLNGAIAALRATGLRIGSNSGYDRAMMRIVATAAARAGYAPDAVVASDEVARGRPFPDIAWRVAVALGAPAARCCAKVDDTPTGIAEGVNAGMWSIGVTDSGNEVGLSAAEWAALPAQEAAALRARAARRLHDAGAHLVIDSIAGLPAAIAALDARLAVGERP
ncbi:phosphonoacetaldehyde hydrolase [Acidiphilium sp. JA12-A1]|uniref:phosphonoacetaldehyde hydrolase n=1 Tax=Acidiphilium sp. JA12-A1 TaxID=1464546 RepID=UPI0004617193|nr:phosphonoacetaldehyde hydrolase [Acidiphilium sp. JA12-A1]KDM66491.1 phosphonoacetaldehyde hydrolase PhnX [Acidiphilium sp. JA12-A1]